MSDGSPGRSCPRHSRRIGLLICGLTAAMALMAALPAVASAAVNAPTVTPTTPTGAAGTTVQFTVSFTTSGTSNNVVNSMSYTIGGATASPATGVITCRRPNTGSTTSNGSFTFTALLINPGTQTLRVRFFSDANCSSNAGTNTANSTFSPTTVTITAAGPLPPADRNPDLTAHCGTLRVMLVLDESASINDADVSLIKRAAEHFVAGLDGTGTELAITGFAVGARNLMPYTLVDDATVREFDDAIATFATTGVPLSRSGTNWDDAFRLIKSDDESEGPANLVLFMTDGNPNTVGTPPDHSNPSENTAGWAAATPISIDSANLVKSDGSRIFAIGLGAVLDNPASEARLKAVSGNSEFGPAPDRNPDFFTADWTVSTDFAAFRGILATIVSRLCGSSLIITKWLMEPHGNTLAPGWKFTATLDTPHHWLTPDAGTSHQAMQTTNDKGVAVFEWRTPSANHEARLGVTHEREKDGFRFVLAKCEIHRLNGNDPHPPGGSTTEIPGAVLRTEEFMTCSVYNAPDKPGENGGGETDVTEPERAPHLAVHKTMPAQARVGDQVPITITVHNQGHGPAHDVTLHETPPHGAHIVHAADGGTIEANGTVVWHIGTLKAGETRTVHATMLVTVTGHFLNTAVGDAEDGDPAVDDVPIRVRPRPAPPTFTG